MDLMFSALWIRGEIRSPFSIYFFSNPRLLFTCRKQLIYTVT